MKKILLLTVIAILLTALTSCDPEPIPPGPPPVNYAISTNNIGKGLVTPDKLSGVSLGSDVTFKITPEAGYSIYSIKINGILVEFQPSASETSYTVKDVKSNLYIEFTFVETDILIFSVKSINEKPWMLTRIGLYKTEDNSLVSIVNLTQAEKTDRYYFVYPSMDAFAYEEDGGIRSGKWSLKQKVLQIGDEILQVSELTPIKITYIAKPIWSNADNCYVYAQYTYERK